MTLHRAALPQIHALLEADFVPLELCARLAPLLDALEGLNRPLSPASPVPDAALGQYKRALQQVHGCPRAPLPFCLLQHLKPFCSLQHLQPSLQLGEMLCSKSFITAVVPLSLSHCTIM